MRKIVFRPLLVFCISLLCASSFAQESQAIRDEVKSLRQEITSLREKIAFLRRQLAEATKQSTSLESVDMPAIALKLSDPNAARHCRIQISVLVAHAHANSIEDKLRESADTLQSDIKALLARKSTASLRQKNAAEDLQLEIGSVIIRQTKMPCMVVIRQLNIQ